MLGRAGGAALFHAVPFSCTLTHGTLRYLLGRGPCLEDLKEADPDTYTHKARARGCVGEVLAWPPAERHGLAV